MLDIYVNVGLSIFIVITFWEVRTNGDLEKIPIYKLVLSAVFWPIVVAIIFFVEFLEWWDGD